MRDVTALCERDPGRVSRLVEDRDGGQVVHHVPHEPVDLHMAVVAVFFERVLR